MTKIKKAGCRGITLLDVVVLVMIIAVIALTVPVMMRPKHGVARKAVCKSNLKNIGLLCKMYAQDYDDSWPYEETKGDNARENFYPLFETNVAGNGDVFYCPSSKNKPLPTFTARADLTNTDYAYIDGPPDAYHDSKLSFEVVSGDAWEGHSDPSDGKWTHEGGTNTLWGDGHVEWRHGEYVGVNGPYTNIK